MCYGNDISVKVYGGGMGQEYKYFRTDCTRRDVSIFKMMIIFYYEIALTFAISEFNNLSKFFRFGREVYLSNFQ